MISSMSDLLVRHGPKLAVGGLVVLNLVLIGALVLRDPVRTAVPADPVPSPSSSMTVTSAATEGASPPEATPSVAPTATPSPTPSKRPAGTTSIAKPRLLAANSGRVAWRATSTDCEGSAVVEVTTDGGKSWRKTKPDMTAIVRLTAYGDGSAFAIGADDNCRPTYAWITGPSGEWQQDRSRVGDIWFRVPRDTDRVHAPGGTESRPCGEDLLNLASLDSDRATALCADGRIRTVANGRDWKTVEERSGALALNANGGQFVAAVSRKGCSGVLVQGFGITGSGLGGSRGTCRSEVEAVDNKTAVARRYADLWLWSDDRVTSS